jgi:hypothetical protein
MTRITKLDKCKDIVKTGSVVFLDRHLPKDEDKVYEVLLVAAEYGSTACVQHLLYNHGDESTISKWLINSYYHAAINGHEDTCIAIDRDYRGITDDYEDMIDYFHPIPDAEDAKYMKGRAVEIYNHLKCNSAVLKDRQKREIAKILSELPR